MIITRPSSSGFLGPEAFEILGSEFSETLYFRRQRRRHPLGIYNVSMLRLTEALEKVVDEYVALASEMPAQISSGDWSKDLLQFHERFLHTMAAHLDDCNSVLYCFFPTKKAARKDDRVKSFGKSVEPYRDHVAKVINKLKHDNSLLGALAFIGDGYFVPGYFVQGIHEDGAIGPDPDVHENGDTGFSFARDLRLHFIHIFYLSKSLAQTIRRINKPSAHAPNDHVDSWVTRIAIKLNGAADVYFPNEMRLPNPWIRVTEKEKRKLEMSLTYRKDRPKPKSIRSLVRHKLEIVINYGGDGTSPSFKTPYSGYQ